MSRRPTGAELAAKVAALSAQLAEALDQQTATSEILRVISGSPTDVQPVFEAILDSATRLCEAHNGILFGYDGETFRMVACRGLSAEAEAHYRAGPARPGPGSGLGRMLAERRPIQVEDVTDDEAYRRGDPLRMRTVQLLGARTALWVPLLKTGATVVGGMAIYRHEVRPFSGRQIALVGTFADQAAIAIENVRLFRELRVRNSELGETLARQLATGEVLRAISRAQVDAQPVFDIIAASARRLCGATYGQVQLYEGEVIRLAALDNVDPEAAEAIRRAYPLPVGEDNLGGRVISRRAVVQIPDLLEDAGYRYKGTWEASGLRSLLGVPMLRGDAPIGAIAIGRRDAGAFPESQVELLRTFADQAVIAIENVRLFNELAAKNRDLTETLNTQMATSEILRVISRSPTDVQPVFDAIMENAVGLCGAVFGRVFRYEAGLVSLAGHKNFPDDAGDFPRPADDATLASRVARTGRVLHSANVDEDPEVPPTGRAAFQARGVRSVVAVPIVREGQPIGVIIVGHAGVGAFTDAHLDLLQTFAEQAAIAIENVRLFTELQAKNRALTETLEQQTATGEILRVISRSPTDVQPVFDTIAASAARLCGGLYGLVFRYDGELITLAAWGGGAPERLDVIRSAYPTRPGPQTVAARAILERRVIAIANAQDSREHPDVAERSRAIGYRSMLSVPMLRGDTAIGAINVVRVEAVPFTDAQIELLRTFADQAVIAIENVRLFNEIEDKSRQLEVASRHKSEFLANMSHELRTPLNAIIGFSEVLADGMFGDVNDKQAEYLHDILESGRHLLSLINDILDLSKIEAGRMELDPSDFDLAAAIDNTLTLVRERAGRRGIALARAVDARVGVVRADERKVKQVLLNLLSNALKFTPEGGRIDVRAAVDEGCVQISVADTGVGIAPADQEAIFEEFRQVGTASRKVEGTGLGLALSRKFIELHGGRIWVNSEPGVGSTFTFTLPLTRPDEPVTR